MGKVLVALQEDQSLTTQSSSECWVGIVASCVCWMNILSFPVLQVLHQTTGDSVNFKYHAVILRMPIYRYPQ